MTQMHPLRLELYMGWLELRRVARSDGALAEPSVQAIMSLCDRLDTLLQLDIDRDHRRDLERAVVRVRVSQLALRRTCAHLADLLGVVVSDPAAPLGRPSIDQITYVRLLQLALHIDEYEHTAGEDLWAEQLATRANVSPDRVHVAIVRMLADGVAHLPAGDDEDRVDTFRLSDPETTKCVLYRSDLDLESYASGEALRRHARIPKSVPHMRTIRRTHRAG
jgi:hypothetical protein